jgi:hypothetical protein
MLSTIYPFATSPHLDVPNRFSREIEARATAINSNKHTFLDSVAGLDTIHVGEVDRFESNR